MDAEDLRRRRERYEQDAVRRAGRRDGVPLLGTLLRSLAARRRASLPPTWPPPAGGAGGAGVREPRRPAPEAGSGAVALRQPGDPG